MNFGDGDHLYIKNRSTSNIGSFLQSGGYFSGSLIKSADLATLLEVLMSQLVVSVIYSIPEANQHDNWSFHVETDKGRDNIYGF